MQTPLYKFLKNSGTSFYAFPGAAEDISAAYQSENYKMYFSQYTLLNFPKQQTNFGGTQANPSYFDFGTFSTIAPISSISFADRLVESLRNYVANQEISLRGSLLNNTEYYYDNTSLQTPSEKIFWKWCKKLGVIDFEPAIPSDQYLSNLSEFSRINLNDDSYFPEYLWQERNSVTYSISSYQQSTSVNYPTNAQLNLTTITTLRVGDIIDLYTFSSTAAALDIWGSASWVGTASATILEIDTNTGSQSQTLVLDIPSIASFSPETGKISLQYHRLVQYIGDVNGVSNVQEANRAYTEVHANIPDHTGRTPDILFRTVADVNYKPGLSFPIIPNQYQAEIVGAELFSSPIVSNPTQYPGSYYGQFDTIDFTYVCQSGDSLRRSGLYYGVSGDITDPVVNGSTIDGINVDFNTSHYAKMNILNREVSTFDQFNALEINNMPPVDFEFNAILWYYTVQDMNGNIATNVYGISFFDNPDNNPIPSETGIRFPTFQKLVTNGSQDGTAYQFSLNLNFNIISDNPQEAYNPEAINSLFSMSLFNNTMRMLGNLNNSFLDVLSNQTDLQTAISNMQQLLYSQTDINLINAQISNLESLLQNYSTQQLVSSSTIQVETLNTSPSKIQLNNIDTAYYSADAYLTSNMYNLNGSIPISVTPPTNKDFLVQIQNDDIVAVTLPNNDRLKLSITSDLAFKQTMDIVIEASDLATQNKKLDIYITTINPLGSTGATGSSSSTTPPVETLLIGGIDLPILFNTNTSQPNSASTWKGFNFDIDFTHNIQLLSGNYLQFKLDANDMIVTNSVKVGDTLVLNNLFIGTSSTFDFSGQYRVNSVVGATVSLDVNNNSDFVAYASSTYPLNIHMPLVPSSILANMPYLSLNKGYFIKITRTDSLDNVTLGNKYLVDVRDLQY